MLKWENKEFKVFFKFLIKNFIIGVMDFEFKFFVFGLRSCGVCKFKCYKF